MKVVNPTKMLSLLFKNIRKNRTKLEKVQTEFIRNPLNPKEIIETKILFLFNGKLK